MLQGLLEKAKNIQAASVFASFNAAKLNFPIAIVRVFSNVCTMSMKFLRSALRMKKKKQQKEPKVMQNSTTNVERPMKQSLMVAAICLNAFWKLKHKNAILYPDLLIIIYLSNLQNLRMDVNAVKETV